MPKKDEDSGDLTHSNLNETIDTLKKKLEQKLTKMQSKNTFFQQPAKIGCIDMLIEKLEALKTNPTHENFKEILQFIQKIKFKPTSGNSLHLEDIMLRRKKEILVANNAHHDPTQQLLKRALNPLTKHTEDLLIETHQDLLKLARSLHLILVWEYHYKFPSKNEHFVEWEQNYSDPVEQKKHSAIGDYVRRTTLNGEHIEEKLGLNGCDVENAAIRKEIDAFVTKIAKDDKQKLAFIDYMLHVCQQHTQILLVGEPKDKISYKNKELIPGSTSHILNWKNDAGKIVYEMEVVLETLKHDEDSSCDDQFCYADEEGNLRFEPLDAEAIEALMERQKNKKLTPLLKAFGTVELTYDEETEAVKPIITKVGYISFYHELKHKSVVRRERAYLKEHSVKPKTR